MRLFIVDTIATIAFFTVVATLSELLIAGMEPTEVLTTRLLMVPIMVATGRPYTGWRDWLTARVSPNGPLGAMLTDTAAFLLFQVPIYGATLLFAGASVNEALAAIGSAIVFMVLLARPFGLFVDGARRAFGPPL